MVLNEGAGGRGVKTYVEDTMELHILLKSRTF